MSEKVLCVLQVAKTGWSKVIHEKLIITSDRTFVISEWVKHMQAGTYAGGSFDIATLIFASAQAVSDAKKTAEGKKNMRRRERYNPTPEELLEADEDNFTIINSNVTEVKLKKNIFGTISIDIFTDEEKFGWLLGGMDNKTKDVKLEDYENMLRPVFGDRLSVKK